MSARLRLLSVLASDTDEFDRQAGALVAAGWTPIVKSFRAIHGSGNYYARVVMLFRAPVIGPESAVDNQNGPT